ncbi:MAG: response regulator [Terriglobales bacterium]|jgi:DNA-binding response OmpR family regulator
MEEQLRRRILVVDSEEHAADLVRNLLAQAGFDVTTSTDCAAVPHLLQSSEFDVVFLDETLAGQLLDSIQFAVRKAAHKPQVIILQSGMSVPRGMASSSLPVDGIVNKRRACDILAVAGDAVTKAPAVLKKA